LRSIFVSTGKCASSWPEPECRSARNPSLGVTRPTRAPALRPMYFSHYCHTHHKRTERVLSGILQFLCIHIRPCSSECCLPRRIRVTRRCFARSSKGNGGFMSTCAQNLGVLRSLPPSLCLCWISSPRVRSHLVTAAPDPCYTSRGAIRVVIDQTNDVCTSEPICALDLRPFPVESAGLQQERVQCS
jgi:hypothetical protein